MSSVMVAESGFEALTMSALARRLEVSAASLYKHFPSKQAILGEMAHEVVHEIDHVLTTVTADRPPHTWETLALMCGSYAKLYTCRPATSAVMNAFIVDPRKLLTDDKRALVWIPMERWWGEIEAVLTAMGLPREDAYRTGWLVWSTIQGVLMASDFGENRNLTDTVQQAGDAVLWLLRGSRLTLEADHEATWRAAFAHGADSTQTFLQTLESP
jgi:AcrR family transcriptional regulator